MSAVRKVIEGTWEDVLTHAKDLEGHRLRVIVLDERHEGVVHPALDNSPEGLEAWGKRLEEWANRRPVVRGHVDDSRDSIQEDRLTLQW